MTSRKIELPILFADDDPIRRAKWEKESATFYLHQEYKGIQPLNIVHELLRSLSSLKIPAYCLSAVNTRLHTSYGGAGNDLDMAVFLPDKAPPNLLHDWLLSMSGKLSAKLEVIKSIFPEI